MKYQKILTILIVVILAIFLTSCGGGKGAEAPPAEATVAEAPTATPVPPTTTPISPTPTPAPPTPTSVPPTATPAPEMSAFDAVLQAAQDYLSENRPPVISAEALYENLNDGDADNDPFIISVRAPEDYAKGHIPGAINIPWKTIADPDNLAKIPEDQPIVVYCYTGHTGAIATTILNLLGYEATNLKYGMMGWTHDDEVFGQARYDAATAPDYPVETEVNEATETYKHPEPDVDVSNPDDIVRAAAAAYLADGRPPVISAEALYENLNDGDTDNDPFIISVRAPEDYAKGHIPGAINIPWKTIADPDNLAKIPDDKPIVVYCYTGHTGGIATTILNALGYEATNLKYGIMGWTHDDEVFGQARYDAATAPDYPVERAAGGESALLGDVEVAWEDGPDFIKAEALYENLNDGDTDNDPFIISVRAPEDYAKGHIPGAVNISVKDLFNPDVISTLPDDREIVVVCYTGQTASQATAALEIAGYDAKALLFGMSSWTTDPNIFVKRFNPEKAAHDYPTTTEAGAWGDETFDLPEPPAADAVPAADAWLDDGPDFIKADALYENLNDGDTDNDPLIISVRAKEDYEKGHIPGAVWANPKELFTPEMLSKIDPDREIVVVCYTGQAASQVTAGLNDLGYHAKALLHGMSSWTTDPKVFVKRFNPEKAAHDYPVEKGAGGESALLGDVEAAWEDGTDFIKAEDLYANLNDGDTDNDPFIISLRAPEDYAKGHIPGSVNIVPPKIFTPDVIATLPKDREIVAECYSGHGAAQVVSALEIAGYDARSLLFGISSWTTDPALTIKSFNPEKSPHDYPVSTEPGDWGDETYDLPQPPASNPIADAASWLSDGPNVLPANVLFENLNDGDTDNDPLIISVRAKEDYEKGHIPGAVWASPKELFTPEMLSKINPERQIVVVCYTGQAAGEVVAGLSDLGYNATALLHGMSGWTTDPNVFVKRFNPEKHAHDYPIEK